MHVPGQVIVYLAFAISRLALAASTATASGEPAVLVLRGILHATALRVIALCIAAIVLGVRCVGHGCLVRSVVVGIQRADMFTDSWACYEGTFGKSLKSFSDREAGSITPSSFEPKGKLLIAREDTISFHLCGSSSNEKWHGI